MPPKPPSPRNWLETEGPWGLTWHHWLAALCSAPSAGAALWFFLHARPWTGFFFLVFAFMLRAWVLGEDLTAADGDDDGAGGGGS